VEHAVIVHINLLDRQIETRRQYEAVQILEDQLERAIKDVSAGEFDGDEFENDKCVLYMYGPDADRLYQAIEPVLKAAQLASGGYAIKRYGTAGNLNARETRVTW
jgi:hypothetical protein